MVWKIAGYVNKLKDWAKGLVTSFTSKMPSGSPNSFQINLMQEVLREDGRLGQGELLTESKSRFECKRNYWIIKNYESSRCSKNSKKD